MYIDTALYESLGVYPWIWAHEWVPCGMVNHDWTERDGVNHEDSSFSRSTGDYTMLKKSKRIFSIIRILGIRPQNVIRTHRRERDVLLQGQWTQSAFEFSGSCVGPFVRSCLFVSMEGCWRLCVPRL